MSAQSFRKRPVVIEAFQMTEARRQDNSEWPNWLHVAWNKEIEDEGAVYPFGVLTEAGSDGKDKLRIQTKEGTMRVEWGDWIIKGVQGELYACKPDIFEATYEPAESAPAVTVTVTVTVTEEMQNHMAETLFLADNPTCVWAEYKTPNGHAYNRYMMLANAALKSTTPQTGSQE